MIRKFLVLAALLAVAVYPSATRAGTWNVNVKNETTHCAWITLYHSHGIYTAYSIVGRGFVAPGATETFHVESWHELKVRAEVKGGAACTNTPNIADTYDIYKNANEHSGPFNSHLVNNNGRFNLWFH